MRLSLAGFESKKFRVLSDTYRSMFSEISTARCLVTLHRGVRGSRSSEGLRFFYRQGSSRTRSTVGCISTGRPIIYVPVLLTST
jgi:hypothetical protein